MNEGIITRTRIEETGAWEFFRVVHRERFRGQTLWTVGYELSIQNEGHFGKGLVARRPICAGQAITQYEGNVITKNMARAIREGEDGKVLSSHFCTPKNARGLVINGFAIHPCPLPSPIPGHAIGTPISISDIKGHGGGSFCNHSDDPNAKFAVDKSGIGIEVFVIALRAIEAGEYIHVDYRSAFLNSCITNI